MNASAECNMPGPSRRLGLSGSWVKFEGQHVLLPLSLKCAHILVLRDRVTQEPEVAFDVCFAAEVRLLLHMRDASNEH